jgi:hypothetical protein
MDIKDLNKSQLVLLTLLISFVVSIATGVTTVSLMQQNPDPVPQTINRIIQRTIEKVSTEEVTEKDTEEETEELPVYGGQFVVNLYAISEPVISEGETLSAEDYKYKLVGQGVLISDRGLVLTEANLLNDKDIYTAELNGTFFSTEIVKKFKNGFTTVSFIEEVITIPKSMISVPQAEENPPIDNTQ